MIALEVSLLTTAAPSLVWLSCCKLARVLSSRDDIDGDGHDDHANHADHDNNADHAAIVLLNVACTKY